MTCGELSLQLELMLLTDPDIASQQVVLLPHGRGGVQPLEFVYLSLDNSKVLLEAQR